MTDYRPIPDKLVRLVDVLVQKTKSSQIRWAPTGVDNKFVYSTSRSSVVIDGRTDSDGDFQGGIAILDARGAEVEKLRTTFEGQDEEDRFVWGPNNARLQELFTLARRSALDIDSILDDLMGDLEEE